MGAVGTLILIAILNFLEAPLLVGIGQSITTLPDTAFGIVDYIGDIVNVDVNGGLSKIFFGVGASLLILGFVKKGFETYVSYTDGDPDSDPISLVTLMCKAIFVMCSFDTIYKWMATVVTNLTTQSITAITTATQTDMNTLVDAFKIGKDGLNLLPGIFGFIFGIIYYIVYFSIIKNSVEIFILKLGLPIACVGLLNADKGIFKNYMMSFIKSLVTILVKIILTQLGYSITLLGASLGKNQTGLSSLTGIIVGICCIMLALSSPKLLSEFMVPSSGGGVMNKAYYASSFISRIRK